MSVVTNDNTAARAEVGKLRTLYRLLAMLSKARVVEDVYEAALSGLKNATAANRAAVLLFDDDGVIRFKASTGLSPGYCEAVTGHSPWPQGFKNAEPLIVGDAFSDPDLAPYRHILETEGIRSMAFIPLTLEAGVIGKFMLYYDEPHICDGEELEMSQAIAAHVALATEHKRAEMARLRSEQRLQAILDNSPTIIFLKDSEGRYQLVNRQCEALFGGRDAIGKTDFELFPKDVAEGLRANDDSVHAAGKPIWAEERIPLDDGTHTYLAVKFPVDGTDGKPSGVGGIATDITERITLEEASRLLASIVESSDDAIISKDLNGIITSWNKGAERLYQYTAAEVIGRPVSILGTPEMLDEMPNILKRIRAGQRVEHYETRRRRRDGQVLDVAITVSPIRDSEGRIVGASKIAHDISGRKQAEHERMALLTRERDARRIAELLNLVGPRIVQQLDLHKLVQDITDLATELVGAEFGAFFHNVIDQEGGSYMLYALSGVPREAFATFPMPRKTDLFGPTFNGEDVVCVDDVTKDPRYGKNAPYYGMPAGHLPVRSYLAAPVVSRSGEVLGGLFFGHHEPGRFLPTQKEIIVGLAAQSAIAMDNARLFEQSQWVQTELKRSNEELRRANQDLEVFAYSASHDLQEPLRTIAISAQLLERSLGGQLKGDDALFLSNILASSKRMSVLLQDLLAYTSATKHEQGPAPVIDAGAVLQGVLEGMSGALEEAGAVVTSGPLPAVPIHESRLAQVLQNLISNAVKYRRGREPNVHLSAEEHDGWWVFSVSDNGIGIDPKFTKQIFGLFKRLHGRDEYPGSGIGLSICQRVIEQYGGKIWLERSALGEGSTFCFSIPCR